MSLKYFEGKIVTILAGPISRDLKAEAAYFGNPEAYPRNLTDYFLGRVISSNSNSIVLEHPTLKMRSYFRLENIIGVVEENFSTDPKAMEKMKPQATETVQPPVPQAQTPMQPKPDDSVFCPSCGTILKMPNAPPGAAVQCPACSSQFILPKSKTTKAQAAPAMPTNDSKHVDIDALSQISKEN